VRVVLRLVFGAAVVAAGAMAGACGARVFTRPAGPGQPAPVAAEAWTRATSACRGVRNDLPTLTLAGGRIDGQRVPPVRVIGAVTAAGEVRLEADYGGRAVFVMSGTDDRALFVLQWETEPDEYVLAPVAEVLDAIVGLRVNATQLLAILTGCGVVDREFDTAGRHGDLIAARTSAGTVYLAERQGVWRVAGADLNGLQVDYPRYDGSWPREIVIAAPDSPDTAIRLRVREHLIDDARIASAAFAITPPSGARAISVDALRARFRR
jgi:hypothetical protein